jgi:hypothetical protein
MMHDVAYKFESRKVEKELKKEFTWIPALQRSEESETFRYPDLQPEAEVER